MVNRNVWNKCKQYMPWSHADQHAQFLDQLLETITQLQKNCQTVYIMK